MNQLLLGVFCLLIFSCQLNGQESNSVDKVDEAQVNEPIQPEPKSPYNSYEQNLIEQSFQDIKTISPSIQVQLEYATANNFTNTILYDSLQHAFLRPLAYEKLKKAHHLLQENDKNYTFLVFDALRPRSTQHKMWKVVAGTPQQKYVANPYYGSIHNYGLAIDLTIYNLETQSVLDMGTEYDDLSRKAEYRYNNQLVNEGLITKQTVENRILLRTIMRKAGFRSIDSEWWHFNALTKQQTRARYEIVE